MARDDGDRSLSNLIELPVLVLIISVGALLRQLAPRSRAGLASLGLLGYGIGATILMYLCFPILPQ